MVLLLFQGRCNLAPHVEAVYLIYPPGKELIECVLETGGKTWKLIIHYAAANQCDSVSVAAVKY